MGSQISKLSSALSAAELNLAKNAIDAKARAQVETLFNGKPPYYMKKMFQSRFEDMLSEIQLMTKTKAAERLKLFQEEQQAIMKHYKGGNVTLTPQELQNNMKVLGHVFQSLPGQVPEYMEKYKAQSLRENQQNKQQSENASSSSNDIRHQNESRYRTSDYNIRNSRQQNQNSYGQQYEQSQTAQNLANQQSSPDLLTALTINTMMNMILFSAMNQGENLHGTYQDSMGGVGGGVPSWDSQAQGGAATQGANDMNQTSQDTNNLNDADQDDFKYDNDSRNDDDSFGRSDNEGIGSGGGGMGDAAGGSTGGGGLSDLFDW